MAIVDFLWDNFAALGRRIVQADERRRRQQQQQAAAVRGEADADLRAISDLAADAHARERAAPVAPPSSPSTTLPTPAAPATLPTPAAPPAPGDRRTTAPLGVPVPSPQPAPSPPATPAGGDRGGSSEPT